MSMEIIGHGEKTLKGAVNENNTIIGADDVVAEVITGGNLNDTITGKRGADTITGGTGTNIVNFTRGDGNDVINLTKGENFTLNINDANTSINLTSIRFEYSGKDLRIYTYSFSNNEYITLKNFAGTDVTNNATKTSPDTSSVLLGIGGKVYDLRKSLDVTDPNNPTAVDLYKFNLVAGDKGFTGTYHNEVVNADGYLLKDKDDNNIFPWSGDSYNEKLKGLKLDSGAGDDSITGSYYADTIIGGDGNDTLTGGYGADSISGGNGMDTISGGYNNDILSGGAGADKFEFSSNHGSDTITDADNTDTISVSDVVKGDFRYGKNNNDLEIYYDNTYDEDNRIVVKDYFKKQPEQRINTLLDKNGELVTLANIDYVLTGTGKINGTDGADVIYGSKSNDNIQGGKGNDLIYGRAGADTISAGDGNDTIYGGRGADSITGGMGENVIMYNSGDELDGDRIVLTKGENLTIDVSSFSSYANYEIVGNDLKVKIGDKSFTIVNFGKTDVTNNSTKTTEDTSSVKLQLSGGGEPVDLREVVKEFTVDKNYTGTWHKEHIDANAYRVYKNQTEIDENHDDYAKTKGLNINGGLNDDSIRGTIYADTLLGGDGDDTLIGGKGNDVLTGGTGHNSIVYNYTYGEHFGNDTINLTNGEILDISGLYNEHYEQSKNDLLVTSDYGTVRIKNYYGTNTGATVRINGYNIATEPTHLQVVDSTYFYEDGKYKTTKYKGSALADSISAAGLPVASKIDAKTGAEQGVTIDTGFGDDSIFGSDFNDTILAGDGDDTIKAGKGADSITGGAGTNVVRCFNNASELNGDKFTLTKGENLIIDLRLVASIEELKYKINGNDLDVTIDKGPSTKYTFKILNYGKTDVTTDSGSVKLQIGDHSFIDLKDEVKAFSVDKNYAGTWHKENIDASAYRTLNKNKEEIEYGSSDYNEKIKGLKLDGGLNNDTITGTIYADTLIGGEGNDSLVGGKGNDQLQGVNGDNTFFFNAGDGQDTITSGKGTNDTIELYAVTGEVKFEQNKKDLIIRYNGTSATSFEDSITIKNYFKSLDRATVTSSVANILINGKAPAESLETLAKGLQTIEVTTVIGNLDEEGNFNADDDKSYIIKGDERNNTIHTGTGDDVIDAGEGNNNVSSDGGSNLISAGSGKDTISVGGSGDNVIDAGNGNNRITVNSSGENTITAGTGIDTITLQQGTNTVTTGGNTDSIIISGGTNVVDASGGYEYVTISGGNNTINGAGWNHDYSITGGTTEVNTTEELGILASIQGGTVTTTNSRDSVTISGAETTVNTRGGDDYVTITGANNTISAGDGNDTISIQESNNSIDAGDGNDRIILNDADKYNITISGGAGNDEINVNSTGAVTINGGSGNDSISINGTGKIVYGGSGADTIGINWESTGENTIYGGSDSLGTDDGANSIYTQNKGSNTIYGGNAGDTIYAGKKVEDTYYGENSIVGGSGNDYIYARESASATISAGAGNDTIQGSDNGNSSISGGAGNDEIVIFGSNNTVDGGAGDDRIYSGETISGTNNTITGGSGNDTISLNHRVAETLVFRKGDGNDSITIENTAPVGNDTLVFEDSELEELFTSFDGNDLIITYNKGADTPDTVTLSSFIDRYNHEKNSVTTIKYKDGEGFDTISITDFINSRSIIDVTGTSYSGTQFNETINGSAGAENLYGGAGNDSISGNAGNDYLRGDAGNDTIRGGDGNDTISGVSGANLIYGDAGNDSVSGGEDSDTVYGGADNDIIHGYAGDDSLSGDAGNDTISGGDGADSISGGTGDDSLIGDDGNDTIYGGDGNDEIQGNDGADALYGGKGSDTLYGYNGNDVLYADDTESLEGGEANSSSLIGGKGDDTLYGGSGNDSLYGDENSGSGNDVIYARYGNNYIVGGAGNDALYSGTGNDNFWFGGYSTDGVDTIYSGSGSDTITIGDNFYDDKNEHSTEKGYTKDGNNLVIATNGDSRIVLNNYFTAGSSVDYVKYASIDKKLLSDMKIYQKGVEHGDDGDTLAALAAHNDFIEGTDKADSITGVGLGSHNDTINYTINDLVIAGKGNDTINVADNGYAEIRINDGDGDDVITNAGNAKRVLIIFEHGADALRGYQKGADYVIERSWKEDEIWHTEKTTLQGFTYDAETTKLALKTIYGSDIPLSSIHVADYVSPKEFKRALDNQFTTLVTDTVSYFVQGDEYRDTITTGEGDDVIYAYDGDNSISAGNGNNRVETGDGADIITAGTGNDTIHAGYGSNQISITGGNNTVTTSDSLNDSGNDTITIGGSGTNTVNAGGGQNQVSIAGGSNTITTGYGIDTITVGNGTKGTNVINSAGGTNTIDVYGAENTITTGTGTDTITARGTTSNTITTQGYGNRITVSGANANVTVTNGNGDTISLTSGGTNTVNATGDNHRISTTAGDNTITINGNQNYVTIAGAGANSVSVGSDNNGSNITVNSTGTTTITGSADKDDIAVSAGTNTINATGGSDEITITGGTNTLDMGNAIGARVYVREGASTNTINDSTGVNEYRLYTGTTTLNLNAIDGSTSDDLVNVYGGTNTINGSAYEDYINIYSGTNTVDLGAGNDVIYVNDPDTLPASTNTIYGGLGSETVYAHYGSNTIYGGQAPVLGVSNDNASNDIEIGGTSAEVHAGSQGDSISTYYNLGSATVYGGAGNDTIGLAKAGTVHVEAGAGNDSIVSSKTGNSTIDGGAGNDSIYVYTGNSNVIDGGAGDDFIITYNNEYDGQKYATITGGAGNDNIVLDDTFIETLEFNAGDGHDTIECSSSEDILKFNGIHLDDITVTYYDSGDHQTVIKYNGGADSVTLYGSHPLFNKIITAGCSEGISFTDFMNQRSITELEPQSTILGASYNGNQYNESITGTALGDTILGSGGNDTIHGGAGDDSIGGGEDDDVLYGDAGNDSLDGYLGNDTIYGGAGADEIEDYYGRNTIYGGAGNDTINAHLNTPGTSASGDYQTLVFAAGDGTDRVSRYCYNGSAHTTLQFDGIDDYDALNISYEYDGVSTNDYNIVIQYGENATDKVVLYDYSKEYSSNVNIKIEGHYLTDLNTILDNKHIILPTNAWNSTVNGSASNDYIYANNGNSTITGNAGNDTIESIGSGSNISYTFSRNGDGNDVIINSNLGTNSIVFTGFTDEEYGRGHAFYSKYFTDNVHYAMDGDDLIISYGEVTPSTIRIKDYGYLGAGSNITEIAMSPASHPSWTISVPIENVLQIRANVEEGVAFTGDNNINQYVIGTSGNDTINAGAGVPYDDDYRIGTNVINPMTGQDTIILANCYDNEEQLITTDQTLRINMGDTYTAGADLLWFKGINSMNELVIENDGSDLIIRTTPVGITPHRVIIHNYLSSLDPSFATIKVGESGATSFTIAELAEAKHFIFYIDNRNDGLSTVRGSVLDDSIITSATVAESVNGGAGNDDIYTVFEPLQKDPQADTVHGGLGNDNINYGTYGNDGLVLYGDEGDDDITIAGGMAYGGAGSDRIYTSDDNNYHTEHGTFRTVTIYGGTSDGIGESEDDADTIYAGSSANTRIEAHGGIGTNNISGGSGDDTIYGNLRNDTINGWNGDDIIYGYAGDDSIDGGDGDNYIDAGVGDDTIKARSGCYNTIYGGAGNDSILATNTNSINHINTTCATGEATIHGGAGNDSIWTRNSYNEIWSDEGNDVIYTACDASTTFHFKSGDGNDSIYSSQKSVTDRDIIILDDIEYTGDNIRGHFDTTNNCAIIEYKNNSTGEWDSSITIDHYLIATSGSQLRYDSGRWSSIEYIVDRTGKKIALKNILTYPERTGITNNYWYTILSDSITYSSGGTYCGGQGSDTLIGSSSDDIIYGDMENAISGLDLAAGIIDPGDDYIDGGLGANTIYGGAGNDTIVTGNDSNVDNLYGGAGANTYLIKSDGDAETKVADIHSVSASDVLNFKDASSTFLLYKDGNDLEIRYYGNSKYNKVMLKDYFLAPYNYKVIYNNGANTTYLHNLFTSSKFYSDATFINGTTVTDEGYTLRFGSQNADTISAYGASGNTIIGGAGNDSITGTSSGDDLINGGDGNDVIKQASGVIFGGDGNDTITNLWEASTIYGGAGADSINGANYDGENDLIFTGGKPNGDLANYTDRVYYEGYVDIYEGFGEADNNSMVYGGKGNDTICAFGENVKEIDGGSGNDSFHTMLTNNVKISDGYGTDTLQLHSVSRAEQAYIVMDVNSEAQGGGLNSLYVVNEENYLDWLNNNGSFSEGHGGVKLYNTDSVDTITSSENYYTTTADLNSLKSEIAGWLDDNGSGDVADALANNENKADLIAIFNDFNEHTGGGWTAA